MEEKREAAKKDAIKSVVETMETQESGFLDRFPYSGLKLGFGSPKGLTVNGLKTDTKECECYLEMKKIEALCRQAEAQERQAKALEKLVELEKQKQKGKEPEKDHEIPLADTWLGGV